MLPLGAAPMVGLRLEHMDVFCRRMSLLQGGFYGHTTD